MPELLAPEHRSGNLKIASGQITTVTALDTIATGLGKVLGATASLDSDPVLTCTFASAAVGNQTSAPASGFIQVKTWMPTSSSVTTPIAATTFGKTVSWLAWGL